MILNLNEYKVTNVITEQTLNLNWAGSNVQINLI